MEAQQNKTPKSVIQAIIASKKVLFVTIVLTVIAVIAAIDVIVNRVDLAGISIFGISIGEIVGKEVTHILDTISTIIFVFAIIGIMPAIAQAVGFWLIKQGVKDDYASQRKMHIGFLIVKIPLYYTAVINALYGLGLIIIGLIISIQTEAFFIMFIALIISMYFLLITKYYMGFVEMFAGFTNTMRTGYNMVEKKTFVIVINWIAAIISFLGVFSGGFMNIILCICDGLCLIFMVSIFTDFDKAYGCQSKMELDDLRKQFMTNPAMRDVALTIGYKENPLNPNELTMSLGGSYKLLFGMKMPEGSAPRTATPRTAPARQAQPVNRPVQQRPTYAPMRANNITTCAPAPVDNDQKLDVHLLSIFGDDMGEVDQRFSSLGKKEFRGDLECPIKPVTAQVFKDSVTEKTILRVEFVNKINSSIKKIKYDVTPCVNDGSALGVVSGVEVAFDVAIEKDQKACAKFGLMLPDDTTNGRVKITYVEFSDGLFWDKGSNEFYFTTDSKTDYDMDLYLCING